MNSPMHDHILGILTECRKILVYLASSDSVIKTIDTTPEGTSTQFWDGMASAKAGLTEAIEALQNYEKLLQEAQMPCLKVQMPCPMCERAPCVCKDMGTP